MTTLSYDFLVRKASLSLLLISALFSAGCKDASLLVDELDDARSAMHVGDWTGAERSLQRFLRHNHDNERRFTAWQWLLEVNGRIGGDTRSDIEYLEAMRLENADDEQKLRLILRRLGESYEHMRLFDRAVEAWGVYSELGVLTGNENVHAHRVLAGIHFKLRSFDAGEGVLHNCLALPVEDELKAWCLYDLADAHMAREQWATAGGLALQIMDAPIDDKLRGLTAFLLGDAYEQQNRSAEALAQFEAAKGRYPNDLVVDNRIAFLKKKLKK